MERDGYPTYTTSAGWLGYPDDKLRQLCRELTARGWQHFKIKVGRNLEDDIRRCRIIREEIGWERRLDDRRQPGLGGRTRPSPG